MEECRLKMKKHKAIPDDIIDKDKRRGIFVSINKYHGYTSI